MSFHLHSLYSTLTMECFHGKPAASSTTVRGTFWFCGETPSCEFFCHDEDCYLFTRAMECPTHQRLAKLRVVKDKMKDNYGRPFFTCSDRHDPCNFWQWGDIYESPRARCKHGMVCTVRKVKKEGPTQNRLFYCCPQMDSCRFFEWKEIEPRVTKTGFVLFSNPLQYRYKNEDTGETFTSTNINAKEAYEEFLKKYE